MYYALLFKKSDKKESNWYFLKKYQQCPVDKRKNPQISDAFVLILPR